MSRPPLPQAHLMLEHQDLLLDIYRQMLIVAYSKVKNKSEAMDIVQESWIKILRKLDTLKDSEKLIQWAKTITANTANNVIKRKITYHSLLKEHAYSIIDDVWERPPEKRYEEKEMLEALEQMDEDTYKMFILKYYYDWKDQAIADFVQLPLGTVKAKLHRGRRQLRKWLADHIEA